MWTNVSYFSSLNGFAEKIPVFNTQETEKIVGFFNSQDKESGYFLEEPLKRWELAKIQPKDKEEEDPHDTWFEISFNAKGEISSGEITQQYTWAKDYEIVKNGAKKAVEAMAKRMHWENQTHLMGISLIQHQMEPEEKYKMHFHQDASRYTMVVLLNDQTKWQGGELEFRSMSSHKDRKPYTPEQGHGILFSNEGKQHRLKEMSVKTERAERTILTIHEKLQILEKRQIGLFDRIKTIFTAFLTIIRSKLW